MKKKSIHWLIPSLLWLALIFAHSAMPAELSHGESTGLLALVQRILPWLSHHALRKLAHFGEFAVLGLLVTGFFRQIRGFRLIRPLGACLVSALTDETIQLFVVGRSGQIGDVWLDFSGAVFGAVLMWLIFRICRK